MSKKNLGIITDSVADIPRELTEKWNIGIVPCFVNIGDESYADDGFEITSDQFYDYLQKIPEQVKTAAPSVEKAREIIHQALDEYEHIISINVSRDLSQTLNNVQLAANEVAPERVTVVDSEGFSMEQGWQVLVAAEVAAETEDVQQVLDAIERVQQNCRLYAALATLEGLRRSGRVNNVIASIGSILRIRPILTIEARGSVEPVEQVRTFKRAVQRIKDLTVEYGELERAAVIHTHNLEGARQFKEEMGELLPEETYITEVGPTLGTHIGYGSVGVALLKTSWRG